MRSLLVVALVLLHQVMSDGSPQLVTKASNDFANRLYQKISQKPGNVLVCPLSLHVALALVHQGAIGKTAGELATVLGLTSTNSDIQESYKGVLSGIQNNTLKVATKLFPATGYQLNPGFITIANNYFYSEVENIDYNNPVMAANKINNYVEKKTNGKISGLITPDVITSLTRLILINAVYFQASWKKTFTMAYDDEFKVSPQERVKTKMMTQTDYFQFKEDPALEAKVLKMDYSEGGYSMVFVLPNREDGLMTLESKLANLNLDTLLKDLKETRVEVTIPKFKLEQTFNLKEILDSMGVKEIFSSRAELQNLAYGDNLYVSDVIQKTYINVHENGTEAAAATAAQIQLLSLDWELRNFFAGHPFHVFLLDSSSSYILFEGRLTSPSSTDRSDN